MGLFSPGRLIDDLLYGTDRRLSKGYVLVGPLTNNHEPPPSYVLVHERRRHNHYYPDCV